MPNDINWPDRICWRGTSVLVSWKQNMLLFPPLIGQNWLEKAQKNQKKIQTCILLQYSFDQFQMGIPTRPTLTPSSPWSLGTVFDIRNIIHTIIGFKMPTKVREWWYSVFKHLARWCTPVLLHESSPTSKLNKHVYKCNLRS